MDLKEAVDVVKNVVSIIAVLVGGFWTYDTFVKQRSDYPHANLEHLISHIKLANKNNLMHVTVKVANIGSSLIEVNSTDVRIQQILPLMCVQRDDECPEIQIHRALTQVPRENDVFSWPRISQRIKDFKQIIAIEPGETEQLDFEFVVPVSIKAVRVYSYIRNVRKNDRAIGWHTATYYEFSPASREKS